MIARFVSLFLLLLCLVHTVSADNLYKTDISEQSALKKLAALDVDPVHKGNGVILFLIATDRVSELAETGLAVELLASDIDRSYLANDAGRNPRHEISFEVIYEQDQYRLYLLSETDKELSLREYDLQPVGPARRLTGRELSLIQPTVSLVENPLSVSYDSLLGLVSTDSLESYVEQLQAFQTRMAGTSKIVEARDWLVTKFQEFGYTSPRLDPFNANLDGNPSVCNNVLAEKIGTKYADRYIVIGAHYDAWGYEGVSPGADDNASGTAGVLEIARALKDIETDVTLVFILFDAEEFGLFGSWHYAQVAAEQGQNIVFMYNMDMIAYYLNTNQVQIMSDHDKSYSIKWAQLADSLFGVIGTQFGNSSSSDSYPFTQYDVPITYIMEWEVCEYIHSYRDSTTYLSYEYMTKLVKSGLATVYWASANSAPAPSLAFECPSGYPTTASPESMAIVEIDIRGLYDGEMVPGSALLNYSVNGTPLENLPMTEVASGRYQASIPTGPCGERIEYFVSAVEVTAGTVYDRDPSAPMVIDVVEEQFVIFSDDFETDKGWSIQTLALRGEWQRDIPINDPSCGYDPVTDADGSGRCFLTENNPGNSDVDGGWVHLISPIIDYANGGNVSYFYYLKLDDLLGTDMLLVEASDNAGGTWFEIARHTTDGGTSWRYYEITEGEILGAGLAKSAQMQLRFTAYDMNPQSPVEAGVDGFAVYDNQCAPPCCGQFTSGFTGNTDCDSDGKRNLADITRLIDRVYVSKLGLCCEPNGNVDGDELDKTNLADITALIDHVYVSKNETAVCE